MARMTGIMCVTSAIIAIFFNIFICELIYVLIMRNLFIKQRKEVVLPTTKELDVCYVAEKAEIQREALHNQLGEKILRRPFLKEYEPLTEQELKVIHRNK